MVSLGQMVRFRSDKEIHAAIVTAVHDPDCVNLYIFWADGTQASPRTSSQRVLEGGDDDGWWEPTPGG